MYIIINDKWNNLSSKVGNGGKVQCFLKFMSLFFPIHSDWGKAKEKNSMIVGNTDRVLIMWFNL